MTHRGAAQHEVPETATPVKGTVMFRNLCSPRLMAGCVMFAASAAYADSAAGDETTGMKVSGNVRLYSFSRNYTNSQLTDLHSTSLGGKLKVESSNQEGFGA